MDTGKDTGRIRERGIITQSLKGHLFALTLAGHPDHKVLAALSGKMLIRRIKLAVGDTVGVELSKYDLSRGRIVWRHGKA